MNLTGLLYIAGVDFYSKALQVDDKVVSLQLWDTAGQERFQSVTKAYYRGAQGVLLVYDISQEESFIAVKSWINSIQACCMFVCSMCTCSHDKDQRVSPLYRKIWKRCLLPCV